MVSSRKHLKNSKEPMTCAMLMDLANVRQAACERFGADVREATNRLSDLLGFMWRRGLLHRYTAPFNQGSLARYAYGYKQVPLSSRKKFHFPLVASLQVLKFSNAMMVFNSSSSISQLSPKQKTSSTRYAIFAWLFAYRSYGVCQNVHRRISR